MTRIAYLLWSRNKCQMHGVVKCPECRCPCCRRGIVLDGIPGPWCSLRYQQGVMCDGPQAG